VQLTRVRHYSGLALDLALPDSPGLAGVPVIAFTAHVMQGDEARFCAAGFDGYLAKPIEVTRFARQVRDFVAS